MRLTFSPVAHHVLTRISAQTGLSPAAVNALLQAVIRGNGSMAQFSHPELGGSGQWQRGGATMVGDMFDTRLQATVSGVCSELSELLANGAITVLDIGQLRPDGATGAATFAAATSTAAAASAASSAGGSTAETVVAAIQALAGLRDQGLLTEEEFTTKKAELLARL